MTFCLSTLLIVGALSDHSTSFGLIRRRRAKGQLIDHSTSFGLIRPEES